MADPLKSRAPGSPVQDPQVSLLVAGHDGLQLAGINVIDGVVNVLDVATAEIATFLDLGRGDGLDVVQLLFLAPKSAKNHQMALFFRLPVDMKPGPVASAQKISEPKEQPNCQE